METVDELRQAAIDSIMDHMDMDASFKRHVAESYIEEWSEEEIKEWLDPDV